jgi:hypothetical protein
MSEKEIEEKIEQEVHDRLVKLLSPIDPRLIVRVDKAGALHIGKERASQSRLDNLRAEAEFFLQSDLWNLIMETPKELAQQSMFVIGESVDDLKKGRSMLYTISTQKNIVETLRNTRPSPMKEKPIEPPRRV